MKDVQWAFELTIIVYVVNKMVIHLHVVKWYILMNTFKPLRDARQETEDASERVLLQYIARFFHTADTC